MNFLRAIEPEDLDLMYIIENDDSITPHTSTTVPLSRYALRLYIQESRADLYQDQQLRLTILDPSSLAPCGFLDLTDVSATHRRAQVGIALLSDSRGRGIATQALAEAAAYARGQGLSQLYALVATGNHPARSLFLRAGYTQSAILPSWLHIQGSFTDAILYTLQLGCTPKN